MSHRRDVLTVAAWELRRYFKWKDQLISIAFFLLVGAVWMGTAKLLAAPGGPVHVALAGVALEAPPAGRIRFVPAPAGERARLAALRGDEIQGVLARQPDGSFELLVAKDPGYRAELMALLARAVRRERLASSGIAAADLERLVAPPALSVRFADAARERRGPAEKIAAGVFAVLMLLTVFTSMAYLFSGITGEKQLRVTESVVSAISPQAWIDGKLLGITAYSMASVGNIVAGGLLVALAAKLATGFTLPAAAVRPGVVAVLVLFTALGMLLWNSFFAAVAATIEDPNTSSRSSLVLLPALPVALSLAVIRDPDGAVARFLALFPLTSAPALPIRLVLSDPGPGEIATAAALLVAAIWLFRRVAGRIFEVGMLLYGKEPTLREVARWARRRGAAPAEPGVG